MGTKFVNYNTSAASLRATQNQSQESSVDNHLILSIKKGNMQAFDILLLRYQSRIQRIVARYIRDPSEGLDVCQEIFIKVYRALKNFRGDSSFYTWVYRIAVNTSKNYLLQQSKHERYLNYNLHDDIEVFLSKYALQETGTPELLLIRDEIESLVYDTIDHLPHELRMAITLRELQGLSYEQIARKMRCPVGTVRSRIFRARAVIDRTVLPLLQH